MTFTEDSDLNGDSPQFTLTCTSTGGPATTVTWTRDSETLSGGVTMLDNPVTAQYTHTLTVIGNLEGQYQCTVANSKPSTATAELTFQGTAKIRHDLAIPNVHPPPSVFFPPPSVQLSSWSHTCPLYQNSINKQCIN